MSLGAEAVTFDSSVRYSKEVIDACIYHFKANTTTAGFAKYSADGTLNTTSESSRGFDYVPGLVAKAVIEAVDYYQGEDFARPWFYSIQAYGEAYYNNTHDGKSLDDLNACKMYFTLADLTKTGAAFENATNNSHLETAKANAVVGLTAHNNSYKIAEGAYAGGWWHKNTYPNQMWCDGQYMGPALLAQMLADGKTLTDKTKAECWQIVVNQFDFTMEKLWVESTGLMKHAFSTTPTETTAHTETWADPSTGVSAEYWGRAEGWYFLALVDVLEAMEKDGKKGDADYNKLKGYLVKVATGLKAKQTSNGCWYQLLNHDGSFSANSYNGNSVSAKSNYEESSCTAIFAASYLKALRLGLVAKAAFEQTAKDAYQGCVTQFLRQENVGDGNSYALVNCCASAGLGGSGDNYKSGGSKYRDGSAAYYLLGSDVTRITTYTEGKVLGAFILAAVEYERAYLPVDHSCDCLSVEVR